MLKKHIHGAATYNGFLAGIMQHKRQYYFNSNNDIDFEFKKEIVSHFYEVLTNFGNYKF